MCNTPTGSSIVAVHMDNMTATASNKAEMAKLKDELRKLFSLVDLGELKWLLGITVIHDHCAHTISLCQAAYIDSIAKHPHLKDACPATTPLDQHAILPKDLAPTSEDEKIWMKKIPYLTAVGSIMYAATTTCPDIAYAVQHLSQFNCNPGNSHQTTAQHVIQYLYATKIDLWCLVDPNKAHRLGRLGLGHMHRHLLLNIWLSFQSQLRLGLLELQKTTNCCHIQH